MGRKRRSAWWYFVELKWNEIGNKKAKLHFAGGWKCALIESGHDYGKWHFVCTSLSSELPVPLLAPSAVQYPISCHTAGVCSALTPILMLPHPGAPVTGNTVSVFQSLFTSAPWASSLHQNSNAVLVLQPQSSCMVAQHAAVSETDLCCGGSSWESCCCRSAWVLQK